MKSSRALSSTISRGRTALCSTRLRAAVREVKISCSWRSKFSPRRRSNRVLLHSFVVLVTNLTATEACRNLEKKWHWACLISDFIPHVTRCLFKMTAKSCFFSYLESHIYVDFIYPIESFFTVAELFIPYIVRYVTFTIY